MGFLNDRRTIVASGARTASGNSGLLDISSTFRKEQVRVQLNVTAASGTSPTLDVRFEDSLDGTNWNSVDAFPQKTAVSREVRDITTPFGPYVRVAWDIGGTTPSFTFDVVMAG